MIDHLLQTINSKVQEKDIIQPLCQKNAKQLTPIQYLVNNSETYKPDTELVTKLLSHLLLSKLSPESKQRIYSVTASDGNTLIHLAVERGLFDTVKCLVNQNVCTFAICNEKGESPLHLACLRGHESEISLWLCEHGYDPYQLDRSGNSPLFNAIKSHHPLPEELFKTMHWKPTSPVLQVEVNSDCAQFVDYYRQIMTDFKSVTHIQLPQPHCMLLHHRGDIKSKAIDIVMDFIPALRDSLGNTILHLCSVLIRNENSHFLQALLAREDCDVNLTNKEGNTTAPTASVYHL